MRAAMSYSASSAFARPFALLGLVSYSTLANLAHLACGFHPYGCQIRSKISTLPYGIAVDVAPALRG